MGSTANSSAPAICGGSTRTSRCGGFGKVDVLVDDREREFLVARLRCAVHAASFPQVVHQASHHCFGREIVGVVAPRLLLALVLEAVGLPRNAEPQLFPRVAP